MLFYLVSLMCASCLNWTGFKHESALEGKNKEAAAWQLKLLPLINALFCETSPIPAKAAMAAIGMCEDEVRLPLVPMQERNRPRLFEAMRALGLNVG